MLAERQQCVLVIHSAAVVGDRNSGYRCFVRSKIDFDPFRSGVNRILHQLLYHRRRPLHHLACGNVADRLLIKNGNYAHYFLSSMDLSSLINISACIGVISLIFASRTRSSTADTSGVSGSAVVSTRSICV